ncbi:hypothetical protein [Virgisporangium aurantiacum]|uniref:Uncharacterized protein n=1 Tax=Virgisporangium aurantiacum TaxID=175570 RepID=A0A8J3Z4Z8_9ACTN|nr:hypothetical protein [Virgisporangium aurantiacum]GIJ56942.1 hypothetical protein Vau01_044580 [Virgisporangium aurantiacum]
MVDDDLSVCLVNVAADARPTTRQKIASSPETRAFLDVGLLLLQDDLLDHRGPDLMADHDAGTRLFAGLSQARLIERADRDDVGAERPRMLTVGMFRDRWRYKSRYTEDLIAYLFRSAVLDRQMIAVEDISGRLSATTSFEDLIRQLTGTVLDLTLNDPLWSLQTILRVALPNHPRVRETARYEQWISKWAEIYDSLAKLYGITLRPEYTWLDVAELFNSVMEGARIRARTLGRVVTLSSGETVAAGAIFAMLPGLIEGTPQPR